MIQNLKELMEVVAVIRTVRQMCGFDHVKEKLSNQSVEKLKVSVVKKLLKKIYSTQSFTGQIPTWLSGSLLRNGPGNWKVGDMTFQHLFDCSALLHRFAIRNGTATYQSRFVQTETLKKNRAAQRIIVTEFGTASVPDPCHSIFDKYVKSGYVNFLDFNKFKILL